MASTKFPFLSRLVAVDGADANGAIESWRSFIARGESVPIAMAEARAATVKPSDPALLLFSSGSTGKPKGVLNSHRGVNIQSWRWPRIYAADHVMRTWSANGLFWSGNFSLALGGTLAAGGAVILQPTFVPTDAIHLMESERVTLPYCWPHQWAQIEADPAWEDADLSSFHYFDIDRNLRRPQKSITADWVEPRSSYGATETFTISTAYPVDAPAELSKDNHGPPLPGNVIKIVDPETGKTLKRGETGELAVKGPTLMLGYLGIPRDEALDEEGFYHAGDGGFIDDDGRFIFQGRINDIIKTGGANVSPVEVDWVLASCPGVKICKTAGVPHDTLGEMVVSCIVPEPSSSVTAGEILRYLKARLASYKIPRELLFVTEAELDLTGTAKIKPAEVRALAARILQEKRANSVLAK